MSGRATGWALEQDLPPVAKLTLVALADECRRNGTTCFPGRKALAECVGVSPRQITRHLKELEDRGLIVREDRFRDNGSRTSSLYHLALDGASPMDADDQGGMDADDQGPVTQLRPGPMDADDQTQVPTEPSNLGSEPGSEGNSSFSGERLQLLSPLPELLGEAADDVRRCLREVAEGKHAATPDDDAVARAIRGAPPLQPHEYRREAEGFASWHLNGRGRTRRRTDIADCFRSWLANASRYRAKDDDTLDYHELLALGKQWREEDAHAAS